MDNIQKEIKPNWKKLENYLRFPNLRYEMLKLVNEFGIEIQFIIAMEELSELIQAISKFLRHQTNDKTLIDIFNEITDVEIMLDQIKIIFSNCIDAFYPSSIIKKESRLINMFFNICNKNIDKKRSLSKFWSDIKNE